MLSVVMVANSLALAADTDLRHIGQGESPDSAPVSYPEGTPPPDTADVDDGTDPTDPPMVVLPGADNGARPGRRPDAQPDHDHAARRSDAGAGPDDCARSNDAGGPNRQTNASAEPAAHATADAI